MSDAESAEVPAAPALERKAVWVEAMRLALAALGPEIARRAPVGSGWHVAAEAIGDRLSDIVGEVVAAYDAEFGGDGEVDDV